MTERTINAERVEQLIDVFGSFDENVKKIEQAFGVHITNRNTELKVTAEDEEAVDAGARAIEALLSLAAKGEEIDDQKVRYLIDLVRAGKEEQVTKMAKDVVCVTAKGRPVKAKTIGQQTYLKAISKNTITIGVGPAGTGKTYLAVAQAVAAFRAKEVNRIILTRPAVEAGERLGFLPGDLQNKVDPYLRPLYDALFDMLGPETYNKYLERGNIEVAPLAYMRGRTLDDSFIILDEAQNTTREQMKMFLTRLGFGSKIVISGKVYFDQKDILSFNDKQMKDMRRDMQIIFQDPFASLNPRMTVSEAIVAPLLVQKIYDRKDKDGIQKRVREIMNMVGLASRLINTYPHELDGGRRQRIGIARALALEPKFIVCDEPVSALDVSIQAQILNLMQDLQDNLGLTYLFITHDLSVVKYISNDILVMYLGQMVEKAPSDKLFKKPMHPYTQALLSAIPIPNPKVPMNRITMKGELTSPINPEKGCRFAKRCPYATDACRQQDMVLTEEEPGHFVTCLRVQRGEI